MIKLLKWLSLYEQRTLRPCQIQLLRLYLLLHLRDLLDLQSSPTVLPLSLSHHVETGRPHQKHTKSYVSDIIPIISRGPSWFFNMLMVEPGGIEPPSTAPSLRRNYNNSLIIQYIFIFVYLFWN